MYYFIHLRYSSFLSDHSWRLKQDQYIRLIRDTSNRICPWIAKARMAIRFQQYALGQEPEYDHNQLQF